MKITGVRSVNYVYETDRVLSDANARRGRKLFSGMIIYIDTDAGITGINPLSTPDSEPLINVLSSLIVGKDPRGVVGLWKIMMDYVFKRGNRAASSSAVSAIDIALWDLKAKINNEPLWKTLGASNRRVKAYASDLGILLSDTELESFYLSLAKRGVNAGKLKVGLDRERDIVRIGIMKKALETSGKKPFLMIDSNEYWTPKQAITHIKAIEKEFELFWCEEPARRWDYVGLRRVSEAINASVATGENLNDASEFMPLIDNHAADILQIGAMTSGITGALQVANLAYAFELPVSVMNIPANISAHLAAVLPNHNMMEVVEGGREKILKSDNFIEDGFIVLGDKPGLGVEIIPEKLEKAIVESIPREGLASPEGRRKSAALVHLTEEERLLIEDE